MTYTIGDVAKTMNLPIHTLRYYDSEGLLPFMERTESGRRIFKDRDVNLLNTIECLKATGMPLKEIKQYIDMCVVGAETVPQRYDLFLERRKIVEDQMAQLSKIMETIDYKCKYYEFVIKTGKAEVNEENHLAFLEYLKEDQAEFTEYTCASHASDEEKKSYNKVSNSFSKI